MLGASEPRVDEAWDMRWTRLLLCVLPFELLSLSSSVESTPGLHLQHFLPAEWVFGEVRRGECLS